MITVGADALHRPAHLHAMKTKFDAQTYDCAKLCRRGGASEPLKLAGSLQGTLGLLLPLQTQQFKTYVISVRFAPQFLEGRGRSKPLPYDISISFQFQTPIYHSVYLILPFLKFFGVQNLFFKKGFA